LAPFCVLVAGIVLMATACFRPDVCENDIVADHPSPAGPARVVVFVRSCGATTDFSAHASLLDAGAPLPDEGGNLFVADTGHGAAPSGPKGGPDVRVRWYGPRAVLVEHHERARVFKAERQVGDVTATYEVFR
jgi:hypothetical protein